MDNPRSSSLLEQRRRHHREEMERRDRSLSADPDEARGTIVDESGGDDSPLKMHAQAMDAFQQRFENLVNEHSQLQQQHQQNQNFHRKGGPFAHRRGVGAQEETHDGVPSREAYRAARANLIARENEQLPVHHSIPQDHTSTPPPPSNPSEHQRDLMDMSPAAYIATNNALSDAGTSQHEKEAVVVGSRGAAVPAARRQQQHRASTDVDEGSSTATTPRTGRARNLELYRQRKAQREKRNDQANDTNTLVMSPNDKPSKEREEDDVRSPDVSKVPNQTPSARDASPSIAIHVVEDEQQPPRQSSSPPPTRTRARALTTIQQPKRGIAKIVDEGSPYQRLKTGSPSPNRGELQTLHVQQEEIIQKQRLQLANLRDELVTLTASSRRDQSELSALKKQLLRTDDEALQLEREREEELAFLKERVCVLEEENEKLKNVPLVGSTLPPISPPRHSSARRKRSGSQRRSNPDDTLSDETGDEDDVNLDENENMAEYLAVAEEQQAQLQSALHTAMLSLSLGEAEADERHQLIDAEKTAFLHLTHRCLKQLTNLAVTAASGPLASNYREQQDRCEAAHAEEIEALKSEQQETVEALQAAHVEDMDALKANHEELVTTHDEEVKGLKEVHQAQVDELESRRVSEVEQLEVTWSEEMEKQANHLTDEKKRCVARLHDTAASLLSTILEVNTQEITKGRNTDLLRTYYTRWNNNVYAKLHAQLVSQHTDTIDKLERKLGETIRVSEAQSRAKDEAHATALQQTFENGVKSGSKNLLDVEEELHETQTNFEASRTRAESLCAALLETKKALHQAEYLQLKHKNIADLADEKRKRVTEQLDRLACQRSSLVDHLVDFGTVVGMKDCQKSILCGGHTQNDPLLAVFSRQLPSSLSKRSVERALVLSGEHGSLQKNPKMELPEWGVRTKTEAWVVRRVIFFKWLILACSGKRVKLQNLRDTEAKLRDEVQQWHSMGVVSVSTTASHAAAVNHNAQRLAGQENNGAASHAPSMMFTNGSNSPHRAVSPMRGPDHVQPPNAFRRPDDARSASANSNTQQTETIQNLVVELKDIVAEDKKIIANLRTEAKRYRQVISESNDAYAELLSCSELWYSELQALQAEKVKGKRQTEVEDQDDEPNPARGGGPPISGGRLRSDQNHQMVQPYDYEKQEELTSPRREANSPFHQEKSPSPKKTFRTRPRTLSAIAKSGIGPVSSPENDNDVTTTIVLDEDL